MNYDSVSLTETETEVPSVRLKSWVTPKPINADKFQDKVWQTWSDAIS